MSSRWTTRSLPGPPGWQILLHLSSARHRRVHRPRPAGDGPALPGSSTRRSRSPITTSVMRGSTILRRTRIFLTTWMRSSDFARWCRTPARCRSSRCASCAAIRRSARSSRARATPPRQWPNAAAGVARRSSQSELEAIGRIVPPGGGRRTAGRLDSFLWSTPGGCRYRSKIQPNGCTSGSQMTRWTGCSTRWRMPRGGTSSAGSSISSSRSSTWPVTTP